MTLSTFWFRLNTAIRWIPWAAAAILLAGCVTLPAGQPVNPKKASSMDFGFYRGPLNHLFAVRRGPCPMHPSCSEYARQAIAKHGRVKGWLMIMDRLLRCGRDETRWAPKIRVNGQIKYFDPVANNDFWWSDTGVDFQFDNKYQALYIY